MKTRIFSLVLLLSGPFWVYSQESLLNRLLEANRDLFGPILDAPEVYDVQIIYTQIDRDRDNQPHFTSHTYSLDARNYYYPASTVKMPIALMALEKLNRLHILGLDKYTTMVTAAGSSPQTAVLSDTTAANGLPSVAHYIKKIFLVSDNDASNRLYEFAGQSWLNERLWEKGYDKVRIVHRLGISGYDEEANRHTNPVYFYNHNQELLYKQGEVYSRIDRTFELEKTQRGKGYYEGDRLVEKPFDFSGKNYISLQDQHDILQAVLFPEAVPVSRRFDLSEDDYRFLYQVMSEKPRESKVPTYALPDHYGKFILFGDRRDEEQMPGNIRIFNKIGAAYGFLTDIAYVVDFEEGVEFMLAATIHVNTDGVYNDDVYDYETIGWPFLANLGRVVYEHEKQRPKKYLPDLGKFRVMVYD